MLKYLNNKVEEWLVTWPHGYKWERLELFSLCGLEFSMMYRDAPIYWIANTIRIKYSRFVKSLQPVKKLEFTTQLYTGDIYLINEPQKIFEGGKRKILQSNRAIKEYAKRNELVYGGDDLDQEADRNRAKRQDEGVSAATEIAYQRVLERGILK